MGRLLVSFLEGYGSVVNLFAPPEQDDAGELKKDWIRVGDYLRHSIETIEREVREGARKPAGETGARRAK